MEENKNYIIGLDLGSGSVGWAVTDENYNLLKKSGKHLWGVRLFEGASDASERRGFRRQRRTINKRSWRLHLLKQELKEYVFKEDPNFYVKIRTSQVKKENLDKYTLFNNKDYTDKDYYKEFPTIYHLRNSLMNKEKIKEYISRGLYHRFLFLAVNDILKNRGNFLNKNITLTENGSIPIESIYNDIKVLVNKINEVNSESDNGIEIDYEEIIKMIENPKNFNSRQNDANTLFVKIIKGNKFDFTKLYSKEKNDKIELDLSSETFLEDLEKVGEHREDLEQFNLIYSALKTNSILKESTTISDSKIKIFDSFRENLIEFKNIIREIDSISNNHYYDIIFKDTKDSISLFSRFIHKNRDLSNIPSKDKNKEKLSRADFLKKLNVLIDEIKNSNLINDKLIDQLNLLVMNPNFLSIPTNPDNRVIPYQLHLFELDKILSIFEQTVKANPLIKEHIIKLMKFNVPYYVGPIGVNADKNHDNSKDNYWLVKNKDSKEKITPYNFDEIVNKEATNKAFIEKMLRSCTYLYNEKCLEQETILYQDYIFYNSINKVKLDNIYLTIEQKQICYSALLSGKSLTRNFFIKTFNCESIDGIGGDDSKKLEVSLSAFKNFIRIFDTNYYEPYVSIYDDIVCILAFYDKDEIEIRKNKVIELIGKYSNAVVNEEQIDQLSLITSKKRGNLSRKFLNGIKSSNGESLSIIDILKDTNNNLMEVLYSDEYGFLQTIDAINKENSNISYDFTNMKNVNEYLKEKYVSPQVRRSIIQAFSVVNEIVNIIGYDPIRIAIEFTRTNDEKDKKKETTSRYNEFKKIYDSSLKEEIYNVIKSNLENYKETPEMLKSKKLFLYFSQLGKDMYSGLPIDIKDLFDDNIYDIDHIYPQSKLKDDSIRNNLVLVSKQINESIKKDIYPINDSIRKSQYSNWNLLLKLNLISKEKYTRLVRDNPLSDEELMNFVNRQKGTLDWTNLLTAEMLNIRFDKNNTDDQFIIYSKSKHVSEFRNETGLIKVRELNDFHHAFDAYLNIVIGDTLKSKLVYGKSLSLNYQNLLGYYLKNQMDKINKYYNYSDFLVTKRINKKYTGEFWNQTIYSPNDKDEENFIGTKNVKSPFGIYKSAAICFFSIVKYIDKKKEITRFIPIEKYKVQKLLVNETIDYSKLLAYISNKIGVTEVKFVEGCEEIYPGQLLKQNGIRMRLGGKTGGRLVLHNSVQLKLTKANTEYLKKIIKFKDLTSKKWKELLENKILPLNSELGILLEENLSSKETFNLSFDEKNKLILQKNHALYEEIKNKKNKYSNIVSSTFSQYSDIYFDSIIKQIDVIYTLITSILKTNGDNRGNVFGIKRNTFSVSQNVTYPLSVIKESVTGFYTKEIKVHE